MGNTLVLERVPSYVILLVPYYSFYASCNRKVEKATKLHEITAFMFSIAWEYALMWHLEPEGSSWFISSTRWRPWLISPIEVFHVHLHATCIPAEFTTAAHRRASATSASGPPSFFCPPPPLAHHPCRWWTRLHRKWIINLIINAQN